LLAAYRIGCFIPLAGFDLDALRGQGASSGERFSVNALGIMPWLSALTLIEFAAILAPERLTAKFTRNGHARPFSLEVIILAVCISALQGIGMAQARLRVPRLVNDPGHWFTLTTTVTMVAGTALAIAVGRLIERHGIGYGFWVMLTSWWIASIAPHARQLYVMLEQGSISLPFGVAALASDIVIIMAVVALLQARRTAGFTNAEPVLWPLVFAPLVAGWVVKLLMLVGSRDLIDGMHQWMIPNNPIGFTLHALIVGLIVVRYAGREGSRTFVAPTIAIAIGAELISQLAWTILGIPPLLGGARTVIVASVLFAVIQLSATFAQGNGQ
jgi:SecY